MAPVAGEGKRIALFLFPGLPLDFDIQNSGFPRPRRPAR
jgi:hypothetical protein